MGATTNTTSYEEMAEKQEAVKKDHEFKMQTNATYASEQDKKNNMSSIKVKQTKSGKKKYFGLEIRDGRTNKKLGCHINVDDDFNATLHCSDKCVISLEQLSKVSFIEYLTYVIEKELTLIIYVKL